MQAKTVIERAEFCRRLYRRMLQEAETEVRQGYPLLHETRSTSVRTLLQYVGPLALDDRVLLARSCVARTLFGSGAVSGSGIFSAEGIGDDVFVRADEYRERTCESQISGRLAPYPASEGPPITKARLLTEFYRALPSALGRKVGRVGSSIVRYQVQHGAVTFETAFDVRRHLSHLDIRYGHVIVLPETSGFRDRLFFPCFSSWMVGGDMEPVMLTVENQLSGAVRSVTTQCRRFLQAICAIVDDFEVGNANR